MSELNKLVGYLDANDFPVQDRNTVLDRYGRLLWEDRFVPEVDIRDGRIYVSGGRSVMIWPGYPLP